MTPAELAELHKTCFETPRPWSAAEFEEILASANTHLIADDRGFALLRSAGPEAELLSLAVDPAARRQGLATRLMQRVHATARAQGAETAFLEVAADNLAAQALYASLGYSEAGRRKRYYRGPDGLWLDALVLTCALRGK